MQQPTGMATLASVMDDLARHGFTEHFTLAGDRLRAANSGRSYPANQLVIVDYYRFEGVSDPDDMSIVYAMETAGGVRGTLVDAFGVYADPLVGAFLEGVAIRRPPSRRGLVIGIAPAAFRE